MSSDMDVVEYDYDLSRHNAIADLRGIGWKSIEEQTADLEPTDIPEEVHELQILNLVAFLHSFTHDASVGHRIPPQRRTPMIFANFTRDLFEPYILREVTKRFQETKASMGDLITATQLKWQNEMVTNANRWMKIQQVEYHKLAISDRMIRARLTALKFAVQGGYSIDSDNDVNMRTASPLPLAIEPPPQFAAEMAAVILHKEMAPILTQVAQTALESQERVRQLEQQLQVLVVPQPAPLTVAFEEAIRSRGVSPMANFKNLRVAAQRSGITKTRSQASRQSSRQPSPQPPPRAASKVAIPPPVEPVTPAPAIRVEADRPYAVAASTPIPATHHNPAASASAQVPPAPAKPSGRAGWSGFSDQPGQFASKYCNEGCYMVGGDGSEFYFSHRAPCSKGMNQALIMAPKEKPALTTKSRCTYCESTRHKVANCGDFQRDYLRPQPQQSSVNRSYHVGQHTNRLIR